MKSFLRLLVVGCCLAAPGLAAAAATRVVSPADSAGNPLPYVSIIRTVPEYPNSHEPTRIVLEGRFPGGCGDFTAIDSSFTLLLQGRTDCPVPNVGWHWSFDLGLLGTGLHRALITLIVQESPGAPTTTYQTSFEFAVQPDSISPLPYVHEIVISPRRHITTDPRFLGICPDDSIEVTARGTFPSTCYRLLRVDVLPSFIRERPEGPLPRPDIVRFIVENAPCGRPPCVGLPVAWEGTAVLPPLPPGGYGQIVELGEMSCPDTLPDLTQISRTIVPFRVDSCGNPRACLIGDWQRSGEMCDAYASPGHPASVTFELGSTVALAGLQGSFNAYPPGLSVTNLEAIGPASGMHLNWRPTSNGARFTLFAEQGAPIPPGLPGPVPVLRLTFEPRSTRIAPTTYVSASELLGSDAEGRGVSECPALVLSLPARICAERGCDFNGDGVADVRDLVLMAHCVLGPPAIDSSGHVFRMLCADSAAVPDCNLDGVKSFADVVCCALRMLREPPCPDCPPDTTRQNPVAGVSAIFDTPEFSATGVSIGVRVLGLDRISGAMLDLRYPADRYDAEVEVHETESDWLELGDATGGVASLGIIHIDDPYTAKIAVARYQPMTLKLTLKPGQSHGGAVTLAGAEFCDANGTRLDAGPQAAAVELGKRATISLSEAHPNPGAGETRFRLTLDRPGDGVVGIYDLGGRLVATLHAGALGAGAHDFVWNGTRDDGGPAKSGVYFYRATVDGASASRKLVRLGN